MFLSKTKETKQSEEDEGKRRTRIMNETEKRRGAGAGGFCRVMSNRFYIFVSGIRGVHFFLFGGVTIPVQYIFICTLNVSVCGSGYGAP